MKKMKWLVLVFFMLCGCSEDSSTDSKAKYEGVQLQIVTSFGEMDGNYETYKNLCDLFQQQTGAIVLDESSVSSEDWKSSVLNKFASGTEPDVLFYFTGTDVNTLVDTKKVVDIETIRSMYTEYAANINYNVLESVRHSDGNVYAIPVSGYWEGMFVNQDLFDAHHLEIPKTWDEFLRCVDVFYEAGVTPLAISLQEVPHYLFEFLIYNYTGPAKHIESVPQNAEQIPQSWISGLNDFRVLYERGAFPADTLTMSDAQSFQLFQDKKAAMLLDGSWKVRMIEDEEHVVVVPFPAREGSERKTNDMIGGFSMGFYITHKAWDDPDKQAAAVAFVESMTSDEAIQEFGLSGASKSISTGNETVVETPLFHSIQQMNKDATGFAGAVQDTIPMEARKKLFSLIPAIATGDISSGDAVVEFLENQ